MSTFHLSIKIKDAHQYSALSMCAAFFVVAHVDVYVSARYQILVQKYACFFGIFFLIHIISNKTWAEVA